MTTKLAKEPYATWRAQTERAYDALNKKLHKTPRASIPPATVVALYRAHLPPKVAARELVDSDAGYAAGTESAATTATPWWRRKNLFTVVVGKLGMIYQGRNGVEANKLYETWLERSLQKGDRAYGQTVKLLDYGPGATDFNQRPKVLRASSSSGASTGSLRASTWKGLSKDLKPGDFPARTLARGMRVELEHTQSHAVAQRIAMDHLTEDPHYYRKLAKMEAAPPGHASGRSEDKLVKVKVLKIRKGHFQIFATRMRGAKSPEHLGGIDVHGTRVKAAELAARIAMDLRREFPRHTVVIKGTKDKG